MKPPEPMHQQPQQPTPKPVMDVMPPKQPTAPVPEPVKAAPKEAVELPVAAPGDAIPQADTKDVKKSSKQTITKPPKQPRAPGSGVGLAIFATIIIVLGLGSLMVYAYLRTNGVAIP